MSSRTWMYAVALGLVAILVAFLSWSGFSNYQQNQANERHSSTSYYSEAAKEGVNTCNAIMDESGFAIVAGAAMTFIGLVLLIV